jgi:DNA polymerase
VAQCEPYLKRQIALIKPKVIVVLGRFAAQSLLRSTTPIGKLRGAVHSYEGIPVVVTYHPAYLLRTLTDKARLGRSLPGPRGTRSCGSSSLISRRASPGRAG